MYETGLNNSYAASVLVMLQILWSGMGSRERIGMVSLSALPCKRHETCYGDHYLSSRVSLRA